MNKIFLIGMMGSGKSVTGKKLAALLGDLFLDLDERIEAQAGKTINEIFAGQGEPYFRDLESDVLKKAAQDLPRVIATGGGIILRQDNVNLMKAAGDVVYLEASVPELVRRLQGKKDRPLLKDTDPAERLSRIFEVRRDLYESACDYRIFTDGRPAEDIAREIMIYLEKKDENRNR